MRLALLLLYPLLVTIAAASWPDATLTAAAIVSEPAGTLAPYLKGHEHVRVSASDYRAVKISYDQATKHFSCTVPIAYYQATSWLARRYDDKVVEGWSARPGNSIAGLHRDVGSLIGTLDRAGLAHRRTSLQRTDRETDRLLAVWNKLEFQVPVAKKDALVRFLRDLYADYQPDTEVHFYVETKKVEQDAGGKRD